MSNCWLEDVWWWCCFFFFFIKCKYCIDQKEQDKVAVQAGNQQYKKKTYKKRTGSLEQTKARQACKRNRLP